MPASGSASPLTDAAVDPAAEEMTLRLRPSQSPTPRRFWVDADTWVEEPVGAEAVGGAEPAGRSPLAARSSPPTSPPTMQMYSLSCEYAAAYIATCRVRLGRPRIGVHRAHRRSANPHWGYRGNIHGAWGGTDDYGVYPEALVPTLNEFGFIADVFYGGDASALTARIDAGMPVMTWLGYFGDTAWVQEDEGTYCSPRVCTSSPSTATTTGASTSPTPAAATSTTTPGAISSACGACSTAWRWPCADVSRGREHRGLRRMEFVYTPVLSPALHAYTRLQRITLESRHASSCPPARLPTTLACDYESALISCACRPERRLSPARPRLSRSLSELASPGTSIPGAIGVISLILAAIGLSQLPFDWRGALLILVAFLLFFADIFVPSLGLLTLSGWRCSWRVVSVR